MNGDLTTVVIDGSGRSGTILVSTFLSGHSVYVVSHGNRDQETNALCAGRQSWKSCGICGDSGMETLR